MKLYAAVICLVLLLSGCGGSDSATSTAVDQFPGHGNEPAPKKLVMEDLRQGSGPVARRGDRIEVRYVGADYRTGKVVIRRLPPEKPLSLRLGFADISEPWEKGIVGMRVGGRRRLVIPHAPALHAGPIEYLIDLVAVR